MSMTTSQAPYPVAVTVTRMEAKASRGNQVFIEQWDDGTRLFCCPECEMAFTEKQELETHLKTAHQILWTFICDICGAGYKRREHLARHYISHTELRPYSCDFCGKSFRRREHLNTHVRTHSDIKSEVCVECGKAFHRKDHLQKHYRVHQAKDRTYVRRDRLNITPEILVQDEKTRPDSTNINPPLRELTAPTFVHLSVSDPPADNR